MKKDIIEEILNQNNYSGYTVKGTRERNIVKIDSDYPDGYVKIEISAYNQDTDEHEPVAEIDLIEFRFADMEEFYFKMDAHSADLSSIADTISSTKHESLWQSLSWNENVLILARFEVIQELRGKGLGNAIFSNFSQYMAITYPYYPPILLEAVAYCESEEKNKDKLSKRLVKFYSRYGFIELEDDVMYLPEYEDNDIIFTE